MWHFTFEAQHGGPAAVWFFCKVGIEWQAAGCCQAGKWRADPGLAAELCHTSVTPLCTGQR